MAATFSITADVPRDLLRMTLAGFFSAADVAAMAAARDSAQRQLTCGANQHVTLIDIRALDIQSQESVGQFQQILADPRTKARRIAFVVSRSLARMQALRAATGRDACYFEDGIEAERWLCAPDVPQPAQLTG